MDQIIQMIQERANIDASQARTAADTVLDFLRDRLPDPVAGQIDGLLEGGVGEGEGSPMDRIGSMFGGGSER